MFNDPFEINFKFHIKRHVACITIKSDIHVAALFIPHCIDDVIFNELAVLDETFLTCF